MEEALREAGTQGGWAVLHLQGNFQASATAPSVHRNPAAAAGPRAVSRHCSPFIVRQTEATGKPGREQESRDHTTGRYRCFRICRGKILLPSSRQAPPTPKKGNGGEAPSGWRLPIQSPAVPVLLGRCFLSCWLEGPGRGLQLRDASARGQRRSGGPLSALGGRLRPLPHCWGSADRSVLRLATATPATHVSTDVQ